MDTSWFKRAVDQHSIEPDSFVYSVPFDSGYNGKNSSVLVTAAHAIFIEHRGHKAAAGVIGLQYTHESLAKHFINITSTVSGALSLELAISISSSSLNLSAALHTLVSVHWLIVRKLQENVRIGRA